MITDIEILTKYCRRCDTDKPITEYVLRSEPRKGLRAWCNTCRRLQVKDYYHGYCVNTPEGIAKFKKKRRSNYLQRKYGISMEDFDRLLSDQDGACAICGKTNVRALHVDHDHDTNRIRGILCSPCNRALGAFGDSIGLLTSAVDYLTRDLE